MQLSDAVFTPYAECLYPSGGGGEVEPRSGSGSGWWGRPAGVSGGWAGNVGGGAQRRRAFGRGAEDAGLGESAGSEAVRSPRVLCVSMCRCVLSSQRIIVTVR